MTKLSSVRLKQVSIKQVYVSSVTSIVDNAVDIHTRETGMPYTDRNLDVYTDYTFKSYSIVRNEAYLCRWKSVRPNCLLGHLIPS